MQQLYAITPTCGQSKPVTHSSIKFVLFNITLPGLPSLTITDISPALNSQCKSEKNSTTHAILCPIPGLVDKVCGGGLTGALPY